MVIGIKAYILDLKSEGEDKIKMTLRDKSFQEAHDTLQPYFYLEPEKKGHKTDIEKIPGVIKVEDYEDSLGQKLLKITVDHPGRIPEIRTKMHAYGVNREHDIPYHFRYLIDKALHANTYYDFELDNGMVKGAKKTSLGSPKLNMCAFDIETHSEKGVFPDPKRDPVLMIAYKDDKEEKVFYWQEGKGTEKEMILAFIDKVKTEEIDVLVGYNSAGFDLPYLKERAKKLGVDFDLSRDGSDLHITKGAFPRATMYGRMHIDAYNGVEFLSYIGALRLPKNDLESVYKAFLGKDKIDIHYDDITTFWKAGGEKLKKLIQYNKEDARAAYEIAERLLPLYNELSRLIGLPISDVSRMSPSQMVEWYLTRKAFERNEVIPRKPSSEEIKKRQQRPIEGGFVKLPKRGIHEHIAVCDFRSLYPSIIISHNLDGHALNCNDCTEKEKHHSPAGYSFCSKKQGLIPQILEELINARIGAKKEMKKHKQGTHDYDVLQAKQWGLKILANSVYGYLNFAMARWHSREAAEATTSLARFYIKDTIEKAEKAGFEVLYADTDSAFLLLKNKSEVKRAKEFIEKINKSLPGLMELEFEGYYPRGLFVTKKEGGAAKKRYALIKEDGTVEIKGFEFVRRDWSNIAKITQEKVINAVLKEGKPEKGIKIVKDVIKDLRAGKVSLEDLVIYTQITRPLSSYEAIGPHVRAAQRLIEKGEKIRPGSVVEYIVTEGPGNIGEKSWPKQLLGNRKPDMEYYIKNQIIPSVIKILAELGVTEDELSKDERQKSIAQWFS
ncbi:MAG: ribonuclease H-like domain-containing protein [DPANN group archaeon]|nr:ribonuclease H-like domain-containing protein [DPANN group archaeon]